jgi:TP901 family phage tail tape measure protein
MALSGRALKVRIAVQDEATPHLNRLSGVLRGLGRLAGSIAGVAGLGALAFAIRDLIKVGAEFERRMSGVRAIVQPTEKQFRQLSDQARELGATTVFTASQAAEAMENLSKAGFSAGEVLGVMPKVLNLAAAGMLDMGEAASVTSDLMRSLGISVGDFEHATDVLAKTANVSKTTVSELGQAFKFVAPIANQLGVDVDQLNALLAVLANRGLTATIAGTALRRIFSIMLGKIEEGEKGIGDFNLKLFDAEGRFVGMAEALRQFNAAGVTANDIMKAFGLRGGPAMLALFDVGAQEVDRMTGVLRDSFGEAARVAQERMDNVAGRTRELISALQETSITIFTAIAPALTKLVEGATEIVRAWSRMLKQTDVWTGIQRAIDLTKLAILILINRALKALISIYIPRLVKWMALVNRRFIAFNWIVGARLHRTLGIASRDMQWMRVSVTQLSKAVYGLGAFFIGWQIGRMIGEMLGLDAVATSFYDKLLNRATNAQKAFESLYMQVGTLGRALDKVDEQLRAAGKYKLPEVVALETRLEVAGRADNEEEIEKIRKKLQKYADDGEVYAQISAVSSGAQLHEAVISVREKLKQLGIEEAGDVYIDPELDLGGFVRAFQQLQTLAANETDKMADRINRAIESGASGGVPTALRQTLDDMRADIQEVFTDPALQTAIDAAFGHVTKVMGNINRLSEQTAEQTSKQIQKILDRTGVRTKEDAIRIFDIEHADAVEQRLRAIGQEVQNYIKKKKDISQFGSFWSDVEKEVAESAKKQAESIALITQAIDRGTSLIETAFKSAGLATTSMAAQFVGSMQDVKTAAKALPDQSLVNDTLRPFARRAAEIMIGLARSGQAMPEGFQEVYDELVALEPQMARLVEVYTSIPQSVRRTIGNINEAFKAFQIPPLKGKDEAIAELRVLVEEYEAAVYEMERGDIAAPELKAREADIRKFIARLLQAIGDDLPEDLVIPVNIKPEISNTVIDQINKELERLKLPTIFDTDSQAETLKAFSSVYATVDKLFREGTIGLDTFRGLKAAMKDAVDEMGPEARQALADLGLTIPVGIDPDFEIDDAGPKQKIQQILDDIKQTTGVDIVITPQINLDAIDAIRQKYDEFVAHAAEISPFDFAAGMDQFRSLFIETLGEAIPRLDEVAGETFDWSKFLRLVVANLGAAKTQIADLAQAAEDANKPWLDSFAAIEAWVAGGTEAVSETVKDAGDRIVKFTDTVNTSLRGTLIDIAYDLGDALADAFFEGGEALKRFAKQAIKDILAIIAKLVIMRTIMSFFPGAGVFGIATGASKGAIVGATAAAKGGVLASTNKTFKTIANTRKTINSTSKIFTAATGRLLPGIDTGEDKLMVFARPREAILPPELTDYLLRAAHRTIHRDDEPAAQRSRPTGRRTGQSPDIGIPIDSITPAGGNVYFYQIQAWDRKDVGRFLREHHPELNAAIRFGRARRS